MFPQGQPISVNNSSGLNMYQSGQYSNYRMSGPPVASHSGFSGGSFGLGGIPMPPQAHFVESYGPITMPTNFKGTNSGSSAGGSVSMTFGFSGNHVQAFISPASHPWYFDSGATNHITNNLQNIEQPQPVHNSPGIMVGNGTNLQVSHTGKGLLPTPVTTFQLSHILHTPHITHNLLFVYHFARDNNCLLTFDSSGLVIQDKKTLKILYQGSCHQGLYPLLNSSEHLSSTSSFTGLVHTTSAAMHWHNKLGHPSLTLLHASIKQQELSVSLPSVLKCNSCNQAKSHKLAFPVSETHASFPFELVHMDVWGPSPIPSNKGFRYYLLNVDCR